MLIEDPEQKGIFSQLEEYVARYWEKKNGRVICRLCPRYCALSRGQRGFCFVRQNVKDQLVLTTYGYSSGFCIDPVEKKPLNHFFPGTPVLSFGTAGCNLGCRFCQNWNISKSREWDRLNEPASPAAIALCAKRMKCTSVAFTYNDPVIFAEYAIDTAKACNELGIKTIAVTAGSITPEARKEFFDHMDAANVDLKAFNEEFYRKLTLSKLQPVLDTLCYLKHETNVWFEITNLIIPGENDSDEDLHRLCEWIINNLGPDVPLHFTAFHPDYKMTGHSSTPTETLRRARDIALSKGLNYVYVGNVDDLRGSSTYCPECGHILIERKWYELGAYYINDGRCSFCNSTIQGYFENVQGEWGAKRLPVSIGQK